MPEERLSSEQVFKGKLIGVRVDRVRTDSGRETTREVVEHPGAVAILPVLDDGQVLLVRQYRYAVGRELLEVPAGTREPGEEPQVTAARELREEVGYDADRIDEMFVYYISPGWCNERLFGYRATGLTEVGAQPDQDENIEIVPIDPDDTPTLIAQGQIADAKTIALLYAHLRDA